MSGDGSHLDGRVVAVTGSGWELGSCGGRRPGPASIR